MVLLLFSFAAALLINTSPGQQVATAQKIDSDRDGISDEQEQVLLERFRPAFMISKTDCAVQPSRFEPDHEIPTALATDGTIYGQVFPVPGNRVEIHYYTLWDRDCGRMEHPLDAEHVSVLVSMDSNTEPKALYWYAGAHEKTACEMSNGARVEALTMDGNRPTIWSSSGKHALFLSTEMCGHGCGADSCKNNVELSKNGPIINIGELDRPMNGALWVKSSSWPLADKMDGDFSSDVLSRLETAPAGTISTVRGNRTLRGTIDGAGAAVEGGATGVHHTEAALTTANGHTSRSLGTATRATGRALKRTWNAILPKAQEPNPR
ncbi:MAG TPA: hypothetical protein VGF82_20475 [Terracidiphilus sp.]|jgi:hypothetical protein